MEDPEELQEHKFCGEDATAGNDPSAVHNDKNDYYLDEDRAADWCRDGSNNNISTEEESIHSSDGDSAAN